MKITIGDLEVFYDYVHAFYGKGGIYEHFFAEEITHTNIAAATTIYLLDRHNDWGNGDSLDRERVRDILLDAVKNETKQGNPQQ